MKLYCDVIKSFVVIIISSVVVYVNAMNERKSSFKPIMLSPRNTTLDAQPLQSRSQSFVDHKNLALCLSNYSGTIHKNITYEQASVSPLFTKLLRSEESKSYTFDSSVCDDAVKAFVAYLQGSRTPLMLDMSGVTTGQCLVTKNILSKKIAVLSDVLMLAEKCEVAPLMDVVKRALTTKLLKNNISTAVSDDDIQMLIQKYGLDKYFMVKKNTAIKSPVNLRAQHALAQESNIVDVILSPAVSPLSERSLVIITKKTDYEYRGAFYTCCDKKPHMSTAFTVTRTKNTSKDAFLFTPDGEYCIMCSNEAFRTVYCDDFTVVETVKCPEGDAFHFFVMSHDGVLLLVTTYAGEGFVYKRSEITGLYEKTDIRCKVPAHGMKPVFSHDNKALFTSDGRILYKYDCTTGKELQSLTCDAVVERVVVNPKGHGIAVFMKGACKFYTTSMEKVVLNVDVSTDVATRGFYSLDGSLCALTTGRNCYVYTCQKDAVEYAHGYSTRKMISQGIFFEDKPYLMLSDDATCEIYDCVEKRVVKDFNLMCLEGANIVVSKDGSYLILTCKNNSIIYGAYPLESFFKVMGTVLEKK